MDMPSHPYLLSAESPSFRMDYQQQVGADGGVWGGLFVWGEGFEGERLWLGMEIIFGMVCGRILVEVGSGGIMFGVVCGSYLGELWLR